jgi:hypothetical protein
MLLFSIAGKRIVIKEAERKLFIASTQSSFCFVPIETMFQKPAEKDMIAAINLKIKEMNDEQVKDYIIKEMQSVGLTFLSEKK